MAATLERQAESSLHLALGVDAAFRVVERDRRETRVCFIRDAKAAGWTWERMGRALDISSAAVRRFWRDHRMTATRLGGNDAQGAKATHGRRDRALAPAAAHDGPRGQSVPPAKLGRNRSGR